ASRALLVTVSVAVLSGCGAPPSTVTSSPLTTITPPTASPSPPASSSSPSALVDTFVGTGIGGTSVGNIDTFPGADLPFGMIQWSPDTSPHRTSGGGYSSRDSTITGFSLTHMSGPGCPVYGDVPI